MLYVRGSQRTERRRTTVGQLLLTDRIKPRDTSTAGLGVAKGSGIGSGGVREGVVMMRSVALCGGPAFSDLRNHRADNMGVLPPLGFLPEQAQRGEPNMAPP